ncbi:MAG: hypothetical protein LC640_05055, partial [Frankia sp.]|nr:hypothetical protein [Frankia sp.]
MSTESKLRQALHEHATQVEPSPDGYRRITDGIAVRRRRVMWQRTAMSLAAVVALVAGGVAVNGRLTAAPSRLIVPPANGSPTPSPDSGAPTVAPATDSRLATLWPLTHEAEVDAWRADPQRAPALRDAKSATQAFVNRVLPDPTSVVVAACAPADCDAAARDGVAAFQLSAPRSLPVAQRQPVATIELRRFGADGPWLVTAARGSQGLTITSPRGEATITSPLDVNGRVDGVHQSIRLDVDEVSIQPARSLGSVTGVAAGMEMPWHASVTFTDAATGSGLVLATMRSDRDGSLASATAVAVDFQSTRGEPSPFAPTYPPAPTTFVAVTDGRVAVFSTSTGRPARYLTYAQPGGGAYDAQLSADSKSVVYAQGAGTCASAIWQVPADGGKPVQLVDAGHGAASHPVLSPDGSKLAYAIARCAQGGTGVDVVVRDLAAGTERVAAHLVDVDLRGTIGWRADAARLVFVASHGDSAPDLVIADATGGAGTVTAAPETGCTWQSAT